MSTRTAATRPFLFSLLVTLVLLLPVTGSPQSTPAYRSKAHPGIPSPLPNSGTLHSFPATRPSAPPASPPPVREPEIPWTPEAYNAIGATYTVTNTDNGGDGSLRKAITDANDNPGQDQISFAIPASGVQRIALTSALPTVTDPVIIDGTTQSGYAGKPIIEINGTGTGAGHIGLAITAGNSIVRGLIINGFAANGTTNGMGIVLDSGGGNVIEGCYIGLNSAGTASLGNGGSGIAIFGTSTHNRIGGTTAAGRNIISGNGLSGIQISTGSAGGNRIVNNYIGLNAIGEAAIGNGGNGIYVDAPDDTIGGTAGLTRNVISGNLMPGVALDGNATRTLIVGNYFGTDWGYWAGLGNASNGIAVLGSPNNTIGGPGKAARNEIYASNQAGIIISGPTATGNIVQGNVLRLTGDNTGNAIGIWVRDAPGNTIGGLADSAWNLVTQSLLHGIEISGATASGNLVQGNRIGGYLQTLSGNGNNRYGLVIDGAPGNTIGGTVPNAANVIQGNLAGGIIIAGSTATGNVVQGNIIGPEYNRTKGNGVQPDGIILAASDNRIGGPGANDGNMIAFNKRSGIFDSTGTGNSFLRNIIHSNDSIGIDLAPRGLTPNDPLDADDGANRGMNFPILDSAAFAPGSVRLRGRMVGTPGATYDIQFYSNVTAHALHFGQGNSYIGSGAVLCDAQGNGEINVTLPAVVSESDLFTATASGPDQSTSEFSRELCMLDTDGDAILDLWETPGNGIDWNCDGVIDLDLVSRGANKRHKDLFVEVDYMDGWKPDPQSLANVETAFRSVPNKYLGNPDGMNGVNLIIDFERDGVPVRPVDWDEDPWPEFLQAKRDGFGTDHERSLANWPNLREAKWLVYRYCIFIKKFGPDGFTGLTRIPGEWSTTNDFLVSLNEMINDAPRRVMYESSTFMHELGHSLGLRHGGPDHINLKPNYKSIMNYLFLWELHLPGSGYATPIPTWRLDFARGALAEVNENAPNEQIGFDPLPGDFDVMAIPFHHGGSHRLGLLRPGTSVNWDGLGDSAGVGIGPLDLNYFPPRNNPSPGEILTSGADWPNLQFNFRDNDKFQTRSTPVAPLGKIHRKMEEWDTEMTLEDFIEFQKLPPFGIIERTSEWSQSPLENIPISTRSTWNLDPRIVSDGHRGAIISWFHSEAQFTPLYGTRGVYIQRIDSLGQIHWMNNGVWSSPGRVIGANHAIAEDGAGGAIITWMDQVNPGVTSSPYNLYAQRIDANGNLLWGVGGVPISTTSTTYGGEPMITPDGLGGAVIAWGTRAGTIRAQRVTSSGVIRWGTEGVQVGTFPYPYGWWGDPASALAHDPAKGTVIVWHAGTSNPVVRAQRIDTSGSVRWGANGIILSSTGSFAFAAPAGEGETFVVWADSRGGTSSIYAQRLDTAGAFLWGATGLGVDVSSRSKFSPRLIPDGNGGAIMAWFDYRNYPPLAGIYGQKVTATGTLVWPTTSICFADTVSDSHGPFALVSDLKGGAILVYPSRMRASTTDIFARHIDSAGTAEWSGSSAAVCVAPYNQLFSVAVSDGAGGLIAAWEDGRIGETAPGIVSSVFAQMINRTGALGGTLVTDVPPGASELPESFHLFQNYPNPFNPTTTIEYDLPVRSRVVLRVYDLLGRLVEELKDSIEPAGRGKHFWNPRGRLASGVYFCRIEVTGTTAGAASQNRVVKMLLMK